MPAQHSKANCSVQQHFLVRKPVSDLILQVKMAASSLLVASKGVDSMLQARQP